MHGFWGWEFNKSSTSVLGVGLGCSSGQNVHDPHQDSLTKKQKTTSHVISDQHKQTNKQTKKKNLGTQWSHSIGTTAVTLHTYLPVWTLEARYQAASPSVVRGSCRTWRAKQRAAPANCMGENTTHWLSRRDSSSRYRAIHTTWWHKPQRTKQKSL